MSFALAFLLASRGGLSAATLPFDEGNILACAQNVVHEFTSQGVEIQALPVPYPAGPPAEMARDIIVDRRENLQVFNGTHHPFLSTYDPILGSWRHNTQIEWSTENLVSAGGIAAFHDYVYVTDMRTGGDEAQGIVRYHIHDFTGLRFSDTIEPVDICGGLDGWLYVLDQDESTLSVYEPYTVGHTRDIILPVPVRCVAVAPDGEIFAGSWDGTIHHFDGNGALIESMPSGTVDLMDIDMDRTGNLILGSRVGDIILTDVSLTGTSSFNIGDVPVFVAFGSYVGLPWDLCLPEDIPKEVRRLMAVRSGNDVSLHWDVDLRASGGYHVYKLTNKTRIPMANEVGSRIVDTPPVLTHNYGTDENAVPGSHGTLFFYQVLGVCHDNITEGDL